jgi:hypothetical protein
MRWAFSPFAEARRNFRTFCRFVFCFAQTTEPNQVEDTVVGRASVGDPFDFRRGVRWLPALADDFAFPQVGASGGQLLNSEECRLKNQKKSREHLRFTPSDIVRAINGVQKSSIS